MKRKFFWVPLLICLIILTAVISGCAPARRPLDPQTPNAPAPQTQQPPAPQTQQPRQDGLATQQTRDAQAQATRIAQACDTVPGVEESTVVISGNTCYVGLDVEGNLEKGETEGVERAAAEKALAADTTIKNCVVVSDVDTVSRLRNIAEGVRAGRPITGFTDELGEIGRRIIPRTQSQ